MLGRGSEMNDKQPEPSYETEDEMFSRRERRREHGVSDFVRRAIKDTVGSAVQGSTSPKDALQFLINQGDRGRKELVKLVAKEFGDFLRHTDISSELVKVLTQVQAEVSVKVRFRPTEDGGVEPVVEELSPEEAPSEPLEAPEAEPDLDA